MTPYHEITELHNQLDHSVDNITWYDATIEQPKPYETVILELGYDTDDADTTNYQLTLGTFRDGNWYHLIPPVIRTNSISITRPFDRYFMLKPGEFCSGKAVTWTYPKEAFKGELLDKLTKSDPPNLAICCNGDIVDRYEPNYDDHNIAEKLMFDLYMGHRTIEAIYSEAIEACRSKSTEFSLLINLSIYMDIVFDEIADKIINELHRYYFNEGRVTKRKYVSDVTDQKVNDRIVYIMRLKRTNDPEEVE